VSAAVVAALLGVAPAHADSSGNGTKPNDSGSDSISATIEKFGQSICPSLVKPGSSLATTLSELQGNTGLTPTLTGMVAGLVIQTQCPTVMSQIANGDLSALQLPESPGQTPPGLDLASLLKQPGQESPSQTPPGLDLAALLKASGQ
jgi:hypothetical protein